MSIIDFFTDWQKVTGTFYQGSSTTNSAGQPIKAWAAISAGTNKTFNFWINTAQETSRNDKFEGQQVGTMLIPYADISFIPDTTMRITIGSDEYYITGVDDIAEFNEMYDITWRKQVG